MRLLSKVAMGASAITLAAALAAGVGTTDVSAATKELAISSVKADYLNQKLEVTVGTNLRIYASFPTEKSGTLAADKNTSVYEKQDSNNTVTIDLSTLKTTKDNYIKLWGDQTPDPIVIKIPAAKTLKKATIDNYGKTIEVTAKDGSKIDNKNLQFALVNDWSDMLNSSSAMQLNFDDYNQLGATIKLRAIDGKEAKALSETGKTTIKDKAGTEYPLYSSSAFVSNEIKAKIAKKANAPKTKVDYVNATITVPNNVQYRITGGTTKLGDKKDWTDSDKKFELKLGADSSDFKDIDSKSFIVDFKIKGDSGKKKPESKYASVNIAKRIELEKKEATAEKTSVKVKGDEENTIVIEATNNLTKATGNGQGKNATKAAIDLENKAGTAYSFQYVVKNAEGDPTDSDKPKVVTSKKKVTVKLDPSQKQYVYVRRISAKGSTDFPSKWYNISKYGTSTSDKYAFEAINK